MNVDTVKEVVTWLRNFGEDRVTFTFHGGEPLLAGPDFYRETLPLLAGELSEMKPDFAMQTNLWLMTPELAEILRRIMFRSGQALTGRSR